jgi:hypothetical protein
MLYSGHPVTHMGGHTMLSSQVPSSAHLHPHIQQSSPPMHGGMIFPYHTRPTMLQVPLGSASSGMSPNEMYMVSHAHSYHPQQPHNYQIMYQHTPVPKQQKKVCVVRDKQGNLVDLNALASKGSSKESPNASNQVSKPFVSSSVRSPTKSATTSIEKATEVQSVPCSAPTTEQDSMGAPSGNTTQTIISIPADGPPVINDVEAEGHVGVAAHYQIFNHIWLNTFYSSFYFVNGDILHTIQYINITEEEKLY